MKGKNGKTIKPKRGAEYAMISKMNRVFKDRKKSANRKACRGKV